MQKSNAPTKLTVVFASGSGAGPVNNVPLTPGATPGTASYQTGFTSVNMEPIASGGVPPFGADFNGVIKNSTTAQIWQQCGYMYPYDSGFASNANINGYPANSVLMMGSGKGLWLNQADNNTTSPDATGSTGWLGLPAVGAYTIATTGGATTPDPSVLGVTTLLVSGALTSNATVVLPLAAGSRWIVANNTTGSFTLTIQGSSGAGVSITQGSALTVFTDGTAYFAASANISGAYLPIDGTAVAATKLATARNFSISGLATAAAVSFDGTGNVVFTVTALNVAGALGYTPANDAQVVHIAGTETISGSKTFLQNVAINENGLIINTANLDSPDIIISCSANGGSSWHADLNTGLFRLYGNKDGGGINIPFTIDMGTQEATFAGAVSASSYGAVNGTIGTFSGAVTAGGGFQVSDRRIKKNVQKRAVQRGFALKVAKLFSEWDRIADGVHDVGLIAQGLKRIATRYVVRTPGKRGILAIDKAGVALEASMDCAMQLAEQAKEIKALRNALKRIARQ